MNLSQEIADRIQQLPSAQQQEVLRFIASLTESLPHIDPGAAHLPFAADLDPDSARELADSIADSFEVNRELER
jgi:predicted pyridoxine 5'-phosphate oxidase superfamily flavin-nucleotide-binding protein